jgi:LuxR family transcriptional regulator
MQNWQDDLLHGLLSMPSDQKLFEALVSFAKELDFDYCAYGLRLPLPISRPKFVMFNNYPVEWQRRYEENNYIDKDPTVKNGLRSLFPIVWSEDFASPDQAFWEEAYSFGLRVGWAQSARDAKGAVGMLTLARSGKAFSPTELRNKAFKMTWLSQVAHQGLSQRLTAKLIPEIGIKLSRRETDVLRWTAEGKTSGEISMILSISERTVNFHINSAIAKLNVSNKTAAAVRAAVLGML